MTDALRALGWVDDVNLFALGDGVVRTLGLADVTVNALVCDQQRHGIGSEVTFAQSGFSDAGAGRVFRSPEDEETARHRRRARRFP